MTLFSRTITLVGLLCLSTGAQIFFSENFEGTVNWTATGGGWEFGTPSYPTTVPEGSRCAGTVLNGHYVDRANYQLVSPLITLPDSAIINLAFHEWYHLELNYDYTYLEIKDINSSSWTSLRSTSSTDSTWKKVFFNISSFRNRTIQIRFRLTSDGSVTRYGWYFDQLLIYSPETKTLTISNDGNGSTTPSGSVSTLTQTLNSISVSPSTGYRFNRWTVENGTPYITNPFASSTTVSISDDAAIQATFKPCSVYNLTTLQTRYNFTHHYYEITPTSGVRFRFTVPSAGTYSIVVDSSYKYLYYYGTNSAFTSHIYYTNNDSRIVYSFTASAGEDHYFKIVPYSSSYHSSDFYASISAPSTLIVTNDSRGITFPSDTVSVYSGIPFSVDAFPNGGYQFSSWELVSGQAFFTRDDTSTTGVVVTGDTAIVKATFAVDPSTRPNVDITDITIASHPDICLTASVTDSMGRSISGLDSSAFVVTQDGEPVDFQLTTVSNVSGVSVTLVIDKSGSMAGQYIVDALNAARQFVSTMNPLDRCAIVSFGDGAWVEQSITSDTTLLNAAINRIAANSPDTRILTGTRLGIAQLTQETNPRTAIVFSDGMNSSSDIPIREVIDSARNSNVTIYGIGIGTSADRTILQQLSDSTGGYYSHSPTASGLAQLYAQIKRDIEAQYILCYRSPDIIFNGDIHEVVLSVELNNHIDRDTVYWNENNTPPVITLSEETQNMIGVNQSANQPLIISADVIDDGVIGSVRLFYRRSNIVTGAYSELPMLRVSGDRYAATIPSASVIFPGIDFYILASDNYNLIGRSPNVLAPEAQPYVIPIENQVPSITHTPFQCVHAGVDTSISSIITDSDGTFYAVLYYKKGNETFFTADTMSETSTDQYSAAIPGNKITSSGIDYYIRAVDSVGAAARFPQQGFLSLQLCSGSNPVADAGPDQNLYIQSSCEIVTVLDGSGSYDPEGGSITHTWTGPFTGSLTGPTPSISLPVGNHSIILRITNSQGLSDFDTVQIAVFDTIAPVPDLLTLPEISAECTVTVTAPTATDNCSGPVTASTSDPITYSSQGTYQILWTYTDSYGNSFSQSQTIIIQDRSPPVPHVNTLPILQGECTVEVTSIPTAEDLCAGIIHGTTTDTLMYDQQGTYQIVWTYNDGNGNTATQTQTVIVHDSTPPVPELDSLPVIRGGCSVEVTSVPLAHDNCSGVISAVTTDTLFYDQQGTYQILWTYEDQNGNTFTQIQVVIVRDTIPPVPVLDSLPVLQGECAVTVNDTPVAIDECGDTILASTADPLTYEQQGTFQVNWNYTDSNGNSITQTQVVIVRESSPPVPEISSLPVLQGECSVEVAALPRATDECNGQIIATTSDPLLYEQQGTYEILWTYDDRNGNITTQTQTVIVRDTTPPVPQADTLPVLQGECSVVVTASPVATDNCRGTIIATTADQLRYEQQGTFEILWTYDDGNGNAVTQKQVVIVQDTTGPVPEIASLPILRGVCSVELTPPYAFDECSGRIVGSASTPLQIHDQGTHTVTWTYDDRHGNTRTQLQTVIISDTISPVIEEVSDTVIIIQASRQSCEVHIDTIRALDNCTETTIEAVRNDGLPLDTLFFEGTTLISWKACDTNSNCDSAVQSVTVRRNRLPVLIVPQDTFMIEGETISLVITASDSDGTIPFLIMEHISVPYTFIDNENGSGVLTLRPGCTDHGDYQIVIRATDFIDTVSGRFHLRIDDVNFPPVFDTTSYYVAHELQLFTTTINAYDCDGTTPTIRIINAPPGAEFIDNNNGTATFTWLPDANDNGFYMIIFEAEDDLTTVRDTIIIEVRDTNGFPPVLTVSTSDTATPVHLPITIFAYATDQDGTPPVVRASGIPSGASFITDNEGSGLFTWTPQDTGIFRFTIIAIDQADTAVKVEHQVTIRVTNQNVTGPVFLPYPDITINQNQQIQMTIEAVDQDGTIPVLKLISKPQGATFTDNRDGSGIIFWEPGCDVSGRFLFTAVASDQTFSDTITIGAVVRNINCAPVIHSIPDVNTHYGDVVRFSVQAYDPDNNGTIPILSVSCNLPEFTFVTSNDGTGIFGWPVTYLSGSFPVTFYATDGILTDSITVTINVSKTGSLSIKCYPEESRVYCMPSGSHAGEFLGKDSVTISALPGVYWFEVQHEGYRPQRFSSSILADTAIVQYCSLKPAIPLMLCGPETIRTTNADLTIDGTFSLIDFNRDGLCDLTHWKGNTLSGYPSLDSALVLRPNALTLTNTSLPESPLFHTFIDWNNDRTYDCLFSDRSGNVVVLNMKNEIMDTLIRCPGDKLYPNVFDVNGTSKKDLIVHNEGKGLFIYTNTGTDATPSFQFSRECTTPSGASFTAMKGPFILIDTDGDSNNELIIQHEGILRIFSIDNQFSTLTYLEDLNCGGKRVYGDSLAIFAITNAEGKPDIFIQQGSKLHHYKTRILGDVTGDGKVDIRDISKISRLWETTERDSSWNPECNLKLSAPGHETIDIRDISTAGKCWELEE